ncbi:class I SAM-dependent methyltransferase [Frankia sp. QA3]|uniref:class I SAM-dependent methyltransferase n=1 Tax=Frankia sp. QA3 TaxID=710111 RepID=UPI000269C167|nr:class I SAM-dependent methyltransferase [Frankia sp. QA3]EIV92067.1 methyltransferase, putative, TIGR00027 family [Frankia sp. QA3]
MGGTGGASRTAVMVCQGRAVAHGRLAPDRFDDPTAMAFLLPVERGIVDEVRAGVAPAGWGPRLTFEMVRACGEVMAPRTVAIDEAVRQALPTIGDLATAAGPGTDAADAEHAPDADGGGSGGGAVPAAAAQVVILGAGLDGRAWRMAELAATPVFEVDHPASQRDKRDRAGELAPVGSSPRFVPVDFSRDDLAAALAAAGHRRSVPTIWIWEGVVPYLTRGEVARTLRIVGDRSAAGSRLIVHYHTPAPSAPLGRWAARLLSALSRQSNPMTREPNRSVWTPAAMRRAVGVRGFAVARDDSLLTLAKDLATPVQHRRSLRNGRILVADRVPAPQ